jgi:hypothetical protein
VAWNFGTRSPPGPLPASVLFHARLQDAEQVVDTVIERERIALEVQEQVRRAGVRQDQEPPVGDGHTVGLALERQQLPEHPAGVLALDLDPRLLPDPLQRPGADAVEGRGHRQLQAGEPASRADLAVLQRPPLAARGAGDEAEIIVRAPACAADRVPAADIAVLDRLRVRAGGWVGGRNDGVPTQPHGRLELGPHAPVVGHVVVHPEPVGRPGAPPEDDMEELRLPALDRRQQLDVGTDLYDRRGLDVARQLGVGDLVVPWPEGARRLPRLVVATQQEVRVTAPVPSRNVAGTPTSAPAAIAATVSAAAARSSAPGSWVAGSPAFPGSGSTLEPSLRISTTCRPAARRSSR